MGIIFPTMGSCNIALASKGKRRKVNKDFIPRKEKRNKEQAMKGICLNGSIRVY